MHWKYLVPATAPSFLPRGSSSSTPHQSPLAKSVSPRNRTTPALVPPTSTRSPSRSSLLFFFMESGSERLDTDSLDVSIRLSAPPVFMPVPGAAEAVPAGVVSLAAETPCAGLARPPFVSFSGNAVLDSFEGRVNIPRPSSHWKYRTPATEPSFFPIGSSSTMPAHWPGANCVPPTKCT